MLKGASLLLLAVLSSLVVFGLLFFMLLPAGGV